MCWNLQLSSFGKILETEVKIGNQSLPSKAFTITFFMQIGYIWSIMSDSAIIRSKLPEQYWSLSTLLEFISDAKHCITHLRSQSLKSLLQLGQGCKTRWHIFPLLPHVTQHTVTCFQVFEMQLLLRGLLKSQNISIQTMDKCIKRRITQSR